MEQLLILLIGVGAVVMSPVFIKQLRPVAKTAIKGGMNLKEAAGGLAASTGTAAAQESKPEVTIEVQPAAAVVADDTVAASATASSKAKPASKSKSKSSAKSSTASKSKPKK